MRSYVLQPYQMVKDLRTEFESERPQSVFDGDIDGFINAGIRWRRTSRKLLRTEQRAIRATRLCRQSMNEAGAIGGAGGYR